MIDPYGAGISGRDVDPGGPPAGICGWCWRSTWSVGESPFTDETMPVHVGCIVQMGAIKRRMGRGTTITGRTVAERRYLRLKRVLERAMLEADRRALTATRRQLGSGTG